MSYGIYIVMSVLLSTTSRAEQSLLYTIESSFRTPDVDVMSRKSDASPLDHLGKYIPGSEIEWPKGLINQSRGEEKYLRFHKCLERGEAFAASYFITTKYLRKLKLATLNYKTVNCAKASWLAMTKKGDGTVTMTLDVLDLSVVHMSAYERWMRAFKKTFLLDDYPKLFNSSRVFNFAAEVVKREAEDNRHHPVHDDVIPELKRTIAAIPFYGADFGMTASPPKDRQAYLAATFWSIYIHIRRIVIFVENEYDEDFVRNSMLPYFDLVRLSLPKAGALPVATVVEMQKSLIQEVYAEFDYFYFTEADQMLVMRSPSYVYQQLNDNDMFTVVPHRLVPYAKEVHDIVFEKSGRAGGLKQALKTKEKNKKKKSKTSIDRDKAYRQMRKQNIKLDDNHFGWLQYSCCLPRQNCLERDNWAPLMSAEVPYMNIFGLHIALGNSNFHKLSYRPCTMFDKAHVDAYYCP